VHVITTGAWLVSGIIQVITGAYGQPGGKARAWHRTHGYFAASLVVLITIEAIVMQAHKPFTVKNFSIWLECVMILGNLALGINYARKKQYAQHKWAMAWTCASVAIPGLVRMACYILMFLSGGCDMEYLGGFNAGGVVLGMLCLFPSSILLKEVRTRLFLVNSVFLMLVIMNDVPWTMKLIHQGQWCGK